jgi:hypothetical protein
MKNRASTSGRQRNWQGRFRRRRKFRRRWPPDARTDPAHPKPAHERCESQGQDGESKGEGHLRGGPAVCPGQRDTEDAPRVNGTERDLNPPAIAIVQRFGSEGEGLGMNVRFGFRIECCSRVAGCAETSMPKGLNGPLWRPMPAGGFESDWQRRRGALHLNPSVACHGNAKITSPQYPAKYQA